MQQLKWPAIAVGVALLVFGLLTLFEGDAPPELEDADHDVAGADFDAGGLIESDLPREPRTPDAAPDADATAPLPAAAAESPVPGPVSSGGDAARPEDLDEDDKPRAEKPGPAARIVSGSGGRDVEPREPFSAGWGLAPVDAGLAIIGTKKSKILGEAMYRKYEGPVNLIVEWPLHERAMDAYAIDRYEVTNAQFRRFLLEDAEVEYTTRVGDYREGDDPPLIRLVRYLVTRRVPVGQAWRESDGVGWRSLTRQFYETNKTLLHHVYPGLVFRNDQDVIDEDRTFEAFLQKELRSGIEVRFFDCPPPGHWPSSNFAPGMDAHPVRGISVLDAAAFAYWAGKHLPTEAQWEYAARGPGGLGFPWNDDGQGFGEIVHGGRKLEEDEVAVSMPVNTRQRGTSWVGCYHLIGNVSEWTGSVLLPYESDSGKWQQIPDPVVNPWARVEGWAEAPIARGGAVVNDDPIFLRPAFRGWRRPPEEMSVHEQRELDEPPPLFDINLDPVNPKRSRMAWTGFRCARYPEPGRSRLVGIRRVVARSPFTQRLGFDFDAYAAAEALDWVDERDRPSDGTYVLGAVRTLVVAAVPDVKAVHLGGGVGGAGGADLPDVSKAQTLEDLLKIAQDDVSVVLGLLQTDVVATNLWVGNTSRPEQKPSKFAQVELEPGVYVVVLRHGYLALASVDGQRTWYLHRKPVQAGNLFVVKSRTDGNPHRPAAFRIDDRDDKLEFELFETLSQPEAGEKFTFVLRVRFHLETHRNVLRGADDWPRHPEVK